MAGPTPIPWHVTAAVRALDLSTLADLADRHPDAQYEGDNSPNEGNFSVRFLATSATMRGVKNEARSALIRALGVGPTDVTVLTLYREDDGAVFDATEI